MRYLNFLLILILFLPFRCWGQEDEIFKTGSDFNSVFQNLSTGNFEGTVNGVLFISTDKDNELILDFQGGNAKLEILPDTNEVYDVSTKQYTGFTTSEKTKIVYATYGMANQFTVVLSKGHYTAGSFDGASYMVVNGINYHYRSEEATEYLVIFFEKDVKLDNFWWLRDQGQKPSEARERKTEITIHANSTLVFAMKRI